MNFLTDSFHFLIGLPDEVENLGGARIVLREPLDPWTFIFLGIAAVLFAGYLYQRTGGGVSKTRRIWMALLRVLLILLVLVIYQRPQIDAYSASSIRRTLLVGLDTTGSMRIADQRYEREDLVRAAIALGDLPPDGGLSRELPGPESEYNAVPRTTLVEGIVNHPDAPLLERLGEDFDLRFFAFGSQPSEIGNPFAAADGESALSRADQPRTAVGSSVREMIERNRGQPLAGIFLISDGANNAGLPPLTAASMAADENIPLYIFGAGVTAPRDIVVRRFFSPEVVTESDPVEVNIRILGRGFGGEEVDLDLLLDDIPVSSQRLRLTGEEQNVTASFVPDGTGDFQLSARIAPLPNETTTDNNSLSQAIRVIDSRFNVLLAENLPRWEYRYLQAGLARDSRVELRTYLHEGGAAFADEGSFLTGFPATREALFDYHVVILGDLAPETIGDESLALLDEWVSRLGGSLILLSGRAENPWSYDTGPLARMLPVEIPSSQPSPGSGFFSDPVEMRLTPGGERSELLDFSDIERTIDADGGGDGGSLWAALPALQWIAPVERARPGAEVLAIDSSILRENRFGELPLIVRRQYGLGTVLYLGSDNFWRWRSAGKVRDFHRIFWGRIVQQMAMTKLLSTSRLVNLSAERSNYVTGDQVRVLGRIFDPGYEPATETSLPAKVEFTPADGGTGTSSGFSLRQVRGQPGLYEGSFPATAPGTWRVFLEREPEADLRVPVTEPRFEMGETTMNAALLRSMAEATGGGFFREEDLHELPPLLESRDETVRTPVEIPLWAAPVTFLLFLLLATGEWLTRKLSGLR
ncbi:MAG: hypothetical protein ACLFRP_03140 [Puniceicoccaceae bacterium]